MASKDANGDVYGDAMVDGDGVVRVGSVVFALIRPEPGHGLAFNHWYERDHFYTTGLAAPGVFSAARFIDPATGWHLALYFVLPGHDEARVAFATDQVQAAAADDRMFAEREHLHTWTYAVDATWRAPVESVPPALVLDHRYPALSVAMFDHATSADELASACEGHDDVAVALLLRPEARVMPSTWDGEPDPALRRLALTFGASAVAAPPFADHPGLVWASSFVPAVVGTDTHVID